MPDREKMKDVGWEDEWPEKIQKETKPCWLKDGCPSRTAVCLNACPDGEDCPVWRWFRDRVVVRCKDCKYFQMHEWENFHKRIWPEDGDRWYECLHPDDDGEHGTRTRGPDWYCADVKRKEGGSE